jgi:deoxyribodipyrimidine photo-lyase
MAPVILWFRNDLRLADNSALSAALDRGAPVIPVYVWSPEDEGDWPLGAASRWWLHHSLIALDAQLRERNSRLTILEGPAAETLPALACAVGATHVYWSRRYEPAARDTEARVAKSLTADGVTIGSHPGCLLFEPEEVATREGKPFQVFTPFWRHCLTLPPPENPLRAPHEIPGPARWPKSQALDDLNLLPEIDWAGGLRESWSPGIYGANAALDTFAESRIDRYMERRNEPGVDGTSRLSPHLHFGEISPRQVWYRCREHATAQTPTGASSSADGFLRELGWREFAHHLLYHFPETSSRPLRREFEHIRWHDDLDAEQAWQKGETGFPIVDAGLRELWHTGWMHNRVRMIAASFLVKDLLIPWQHGARWFWDTLVDADLANNTLGWQWTAGCGADAAPYFRVFNPTTQGRKFDPNGRYVRRWIAELAQLDASTLQNPSEAAQILLTTASVTFGENYPRPIIDHNTARERALPAFNAVKRHK